MINKNSIAAMKRGVLFVNASRGDLVVTDDLVEALKSGQIAGAALDVTSPEPPPTDSPLRKLSQVIINSHVASASPRAARRLRETVAATALAALRNEPLRNIVNGL